MPTAVPGDAGADDPRGAGGAASPIDEIVRGKAVAKITDDRTVRHRTKPTGGPGSRAAGPAMAFTLIEAGQTRWRALNAPHLVALVRAGVRFERGVLVEREQVTAA